MTLVRALLGSLLCVGVCLEAGSSVAQEPVPNTGSATARPFDTIEEASRDQRKAVELIRFAVAQSVESARVLHRCGLCPTADQVLRNGLYMISRAADLPNLDAEKMARSVSAELAHQTTPEFNGGYDEINGRVLRAKGRFAEIDLHLGHGLYNYYESGGVPQRRFCRHLCSQRRLRTSSGWIHRLEQSPSSGRWHRSAPAKARTGFPSG